MLNAYLSVFLRWWSKSSTVLQLRLWVASKLIIFFHVHREVYYKCLPIIERVLMIFRINFNQHPVTMTCPHCQANITTGKSQNYRAWQKTCWKALFPLHVFLSQISSHFKTCGWMCLVDWSWDSLLLRWCLLSLRLHTLLCRWLHGFLYLTKNNNNSFWYVPPKMMTNYVSGFHPHLPQLQACGWLLPKAVEINLLTIKLITKRKGGKFKIKSFQAKHFLTHSRTICILCQKTNSKFDRVFSG